MSWWSRHDKDLRLLQFTGAMSVESSLDLWLRSAPIQRCHGPSPQVGYTKPHLPPDSDLHPPNISKYHRTYKHQHRHHSFKAWSPLGFIWLEQLSREERTSRCQNRTHQPKWLSPCCFFRTLNLFFSALLEDCPRHLQQGWYRSRHPTRPNHVHSALYTKLTALSQRLGMLTEPAGFKRSPLLKEPRETERTDGLASDMLPNCLVCLANGVSIFGSVESFWILFQWISNYDAWSWHWECTTVQVAEYRCSRIEWVHKLLVPEAFRMAAAHGKEALVHTYV